MYERILKPRDSNLYQGKNINYNSASSLLTIIYRHKLMRPTQSSARHGHSHFLNADFTASMAGLTSHSLLCLPHSVYTFFLLLLEFVLVAVGI